MNKKAIIFLFLVLLCNSDLVLAQIEPEEIKLENNKFEDLFYESLLQKSIENNDKAIVSLEQCLKIKPEDPTIHFELGKNYLALKDYNNAYKSFEHASKLDLKNRWSWVGMYDVCYETKAYEKAIVIVTKLISFDPKYKDDLISLYMYTKDFDKALGLINEMNDSFGKSEQRDLYKLSILSEGKYQNAEMANLIDQINKNPKEESNYVNLIFLYSKNNEAAKVLEVAKRLETAIPNSEWAQVSLFKSYLDQNEGPKAIKSMNTVLSSTKIDSKIKHRILNEFLIYVTKNPQYSSDLEKAIAYFDADPEVDVAKEIGKFYQNKKEWDKAIIFYEKALKNNSDSNIEINLLLLQSYVETKQFLVVAKKAEFLIESYPTQPEFYFYAGLGNNQMLKYKKAKDFLEMGLDYVVENKVLEINFNIQLGEVFNGLGDSKKKEMYFAKANQLLTEKKQ